jgi:HD superfamily phosphodiesterase
VTKVRVNAEKIFDALVAANKHPQMLNDQTRRMVCAAAQFHDIADHKYVQDPNSKGIEEELRKHFSDKASASLMNVIDAVSFSKERKAREAAGTPETPQSFVEKLGKVGSLLRDIISDADKLEAIGSIGVQRCLQYTKESTLKKTGSEPTPEQLVLDLVQHGEEKLFIMLKHQYIRTSAGRAFAEPLHAIMINEVCGMLKEDQADEVKRLHDTYDIAPAASVLPAASPAPNVQSNKKDTPGTAAVSSSSSSSSTSSSSSSSTSNTSSDGKVQPPPAKKRKLGARGGSWHCAENTPVIKNGMITGITPRE